MLLIGNWNNYNIIINLHKRNDTKAGSFPAGRNTLSQGYLPVLEGKDKWGCFVCTGTWSSVPTLSWDGEVRFFWPDVAAKNKKYEFEIIGNVNIWKHFAPVWNIVENNNKEARSWWTCSTDNRGIFLLVINDIYLKNKNRHKYYWWKTCVTENVIKLSMQRIKKYLVLVHL